MSIVYGAFLCLNAKNSLTENHLVDCEAKLVELWPGLPFLALPNTPCPPMPTSVEGIQDWCRVIHVSSGDPTRNSQVVYRAYNSNIGEEGEELVQLRVHGFVSKAQLQPLGDWHG